MKSVLRQFARGVNRMIGRFGFVIEAIPQDVQARKAEVAYVEREESGAVNWSEKEKRVAGGGPFEWPNIVALNHTVADMVGDARSIVELGGGTGTFAIEAAQVEGRRILCAELDADASDWARANRAHPNIEYVQRLITPEDGPYDLAVSIEVVEHIKDFNSFLDVCAHVAPRAILTTPNRMRSRTANHAGPPHYKQHVREWSAGEFYWVLRCYWDEVRLYAMPDEYSRGAEPITVVDKKTPLIAICGKSRKFHKNRVMTCH